MDHGAERVNMDTFLPQTLFYVSAIPCRNNIVLHVLNSIRIFSWQTLFKITFICIKNHRNKSFSWINKNFKGKI